MKKKLNITKTSLLQALGVVVYVILVANVMFYGEAIFGQVKTIWGPVAFLMLFVVSAAITGSLVIGRSVMLYIDGDKKDAMCLFTRTVGWLVLAVILLFIGLAVI